MSDEESSATLHEPYAIKSDTHLFRFPWRIHNQNGLIDV